MRLSLCITTYNRPELTLQSFVQVLDDDRISEIIIVDDCSRLESVELLSSKCTSPKIKLFRNAENLGMSRNKAKAISLAENDWVIIFDSDNILDGTYLDALVFRFDKDVIYSPVFARPNFNYNKFSGWNILKGNVKEVVADSMGNCLFNTCNFVVHRDSYRDVYIYNPIHRASDTIWFNYLWLKSGREFYVIPNMEYFHRVHDQSGFMQDANYNMAQAEKVRKLIMAL
jgi:glycosyltransferase involved in cell wall biosynthesis